MIPSDDGSYYYKTAHLHHIYITIQARHDEFAEITLLSGIILTVF